MAKRLELKISGRVQKVGYRDLVQEIGLGLGLTGFVENLPDRTVKVVCEGEPKTLDQFLEAINVSKGLLQVNTIKITEERQATGEFEIFELRRGDMVTELGSRLDSAVLYLQDTKEGIVNEIQESSKRTGKKIDRVSGKLDGLGERTSEGSDKLSQQTSEGTDKLATKLDGLGEHMSEGLDKLSHQTLSLEERTHDDFTALDGKYHTVSSELKEINSSLKLITSMVGQALKKGRITISIGEES